MLYLGHLRARRWAIPRILWSEPRFRAARLREWERVLDNGITPLELRRAVRTGRPRLLSSKSSVWYSRNMSWAPISRMTDDSDLFPNGRTLLPIRNSTNECLTRHKDGRQSKGHPVWQIAGAGSCL